MKLQTVTGNLGVEIRGVDLSQPVDASTAQSLRDLWAEHQVLVIRDQKLSDENLIDFGKLFGNLQGEYFFFPDHVDGKPEIAKVIKTPKDKLNSGGVWHHDQAYFAKPVKGIALYGVQIPQSGGDTLFSNLSVAFDALSPALQEFLSTLQVMHTTRLMLAKKSQVKNSPNLAKVLEGMTEEETVHPLVCKNDAGKPFLYINRTTTEFIVGLKPNESAALLEFLYQHIERHEFTCRVKWEVGSLVLWNNHSCLHYAVNDYNQTRELHRIHFLPEAPQGYANAR